MYMSDLQVVSCYWPLIGDFCYVGYELTYDSLMENVYTFGQRHVPLYQWSAK